MIENKWLNDEIRNLRSDMRTKKQPFLFGLLLIFLTGFTALVGYDMHQPKQIRWAATWICGKCGYENYADINNCPLCGSAKPRKR